MKRPFLVVDPVMVATSGSQLIADGGLRIADLLKLATLVTPNLPEAETLLGRTIKTPEDLRRTARELHEKFGCAALVKGGHLRGTAEAIDFFYDGHTELMLTAPFIRGVKTHGTGCTYSAAIAARLAKGIPLEKAVMKGKEFISEAIRNSHQVGEGEALGSTLETAGELLDAYEKEPPPKVDLAIMNRYLRERGRRSNRPLPKK